MFKVLDLFSGIGAYSLGLERSGGFETVAFCEINAFCRRILNKHWPHVPTFEDVTKLTGSGLRADGIVPDWIVAGWPCQDISSAGTGHGLDGVRSGLWTEVARLAGELRPRGLLLENSSNLLSINGGADFGRVLGDLAALGYDAEWHCLPAAAFDAPHIRDRLWIVATMADAARHGEPREPTTAGAKRKRARARGAGGGALVSSGADVDSAGVAGLRSALGIPAQEPERNAADAGAPANADRVAPIGAAIARAERVSWLPEPDVGRVVHGAPDRVERIHALGNLNPPIVPETIGRAILAAGIAA